MHDIGFVILTWNSDKYVKTCLDSITAFEKIKYSICVIDNGSKDTTLDILYDYQRTFPDGRLNIVEFSENKGTTVSRNIGLRYFKDKCKYICVLDSDTMVSEEAIQKLINVLGDNPKAGIIGPVLKSLDGSVQNSGRRIPNITLKLLKVMPLKALRQKGEQMEKLPQNGEVMPVGYLMSACWVFKSSLINKIGLLDENIFYAPEDVEYCLRAWKSGFQVLYVRDTHIIHIWQRLSRKKLFSKHNWEHLKGLGYLFRKYHYCFYEPAYVKYE